MLSKLVKLINLNIILWSKIPLNYLNEAKIPFVSFLLKNTPTLSISFKNILLSNDRSPNTPHEIKLRYN